MARRTVQRIWLGLGAAVLAGSLPLSGSVQAGEGAGSAHSHAGAKPDANAPATAGPNAAAGTPSAGGEGGESGGQGAVKVHPDVRFYRAIELIRGHLLVGDELVADGHWDEALPHFLHPTEELYPIVKADLKTYKSQPFESALKALAQTVKARKADSYKAALSLVEEHLQRADAGVRGFRPEWPAFSLEVALELMRTAAEEYGAALGPGADGAEAIKSPVEYQDSRGFVWQAERMIEAVAPELEKKDAEALAGLRAGVANLKQAWPTALPPPKPVKDLSAVLGTIARIELQAGALTQ